MKQISCVDMRISDRVLQESLRGTNVKYQLPSHEEKMPIELRDMIPFFAEKRVYKYSYHNQLS